LESGDSSSSVKLKGKEVIASRVYSKRESQQDVIPPSDNAVGLKSTWESFQQVLHEGT
jgi:hypothetical protein